MPAPGAPLACTAPGLADLATAASLPVVAAAPEARFEPLREAGRRLVVARDGLYVESRSNALYVRQRVADGGPHRLPYGRVAPCVSLREGKLPLALYRELADRALAAFPLEMAALVVAGAPGEGYRMIDCGTGTEGAITYPDTGFDDAALALDVHSHGLYPAVFSPVDAASDRSRVGPHISMVFGRCGGTDTLEVALRVCVGGLLLPLVSTEVTEVFEDAVRHA